LNRLRSILLNLHGSLNALRPHQARATLAQLLQTQIEERRELCQQVDGVVDIVDEEMSFAGHVLRHWLSK
jgi:mediator of RNA polymerase II transcription subunit 7